MNIVKQIPAFLLRLVFFGFGLAYFFKLLPTPPMEGNMLAFMNLFGGTGYMDVIKVLEVLGGLLLFFPRTRGIGLCIITPITINILLFELLIAKQPGIGIPLIIINILAIVMAKDKFKSVWG